MFEIIICDDDDACLDQTGQLVNDWCATVTAPVRVKTIDNGEELLGYCRQNTPDIILLDIMMPVFSGMDAAKAIREHNSTSKIIFLTSSPEFAIESYDVNATGYLLKPVDKDRLHRLLDQCLSMIPKPMDSVTLHTSAGYQNIYLHNIECLEAQNKKIIFTLSNGQKVETISTLSCYEKLLSLEKGFFKCHRSYIVSIPNTDHFNSTEVLTRSGLAVPIARGYAKAFRDAYFDYMFQEGVHSR